MAWFNPGRDWTAGREQDRHSLRLCFGNLSIETIREGVARLAAGRRREFPELAPPQAPVMPA